MTSGLRRGARFDPATGQFANFSTPMPRFNATTHEVRMWSTPSSASYPCDINVTEPGSVWFGLLTANKIGRLDITAA